MKKEYKGTGTINEEFVINALQGAMQGIRMATPTAQNPFPFAKPPTMEPGDVRGVLHFDKGDYNPTVDVREHGEFELWKPPVEPKDSIW